MQQERQVQDWVCRRCPDQLQLQLPFALWPRKAIQMLVAQKCGVKLSIRGGEYLTRWGYTPQKQIRREVFYLPPYSPELNPYEYFNEDLKRDEYFNEDLKRAVHQDVAPKDAKQLKLIAQRHLRVIQRSRWRACNYFKHRDIRYAA